jgi:uncharacterized membrane protein YraQ (UPF0718 family)
MTIASCSFSGKSHFASLRVLYTIGSLPSARLPFPFCKCTLLPCRNRLNDNRLKGASTHG